MATNRRLLNAGKGPVRDLDAERKKANEFEAAALTNTLLYGNAYKPFYLSAKSFKSSLGICFNFLNFSLGKFFLKAPQNYMLYHNILRKTDLYVHNYGKDHRLSLGL